MVASFSRLNSTTNLYVPGFFFGTGKEGLSQGPFPGSIFPSSYSWSTSFVQAALLSPMIWPGHCFTGITPGLRRIYSSPNSPRFGGFPVFLPMKNVSL